MSHPIILAVHITIALALTILVGVQCAELGRLREPGADTRALRTTLRWIPGLSLLTFITGGLVLADGAKGGPWVAAGVISTALIAAASGWTLRRLRNPADTRPALIAAVRWGVPAVTLAAAFLMALRPGNPFAAAGPVLGAAAIMIGAYVAAARRATAAATV